VKRGEVVVVAPAMLSIKAAAVYCGVSPGFLDKLRAQDVKRRAAGEDVAGPRWHRLAGIKYRVADLDEYLARVAVPFGVVESKRREPSTAESAT
jgi:hypothetical protein